MNTTLERIARLLVRLHGREYDASYGDDLIETVTARSERARQRGWFWWAVFSLRELASLLVAAIALRCWPRWQAPAVAAAPAGSRAEQVAREFTLASRRLLHTPTFSLAVLMTLALAIAATVTMFAGLWRIVLAPLPYPSAVRLIDLDHGTPRLGTAAGMGMSIGLFREYAQLPSVDAIALYTRREGTLYGTGAAERARFIQATPGLGEVAGLTIQRGRWFSTAEGVTGSPQVAVITDAMWRQRFGSDPAILGRVLHIDGMAHEIIGVLRPGAGFADHRAQFFIPLPLPRAWTRAGGFNYEGVARLAPAATLEQAHRDQNTVIADLSRRYPADQEIGNAIEGGLHSTARPLKDAVLGDTPPTAWALISAAVVVFLMACANVANLFLVRHESRVREQAVQRALGAGAWHLSAAIACEALWLGLAGGGLAMLLASAAIDLVLAYAPADVPRLHELRIDWIVVTFGAVMSITACVACGLLPLLRLWTRRPAPLVGLERLPLASPAAVRIRQGLMAAQVTLAVLLLCVAGLMTKSFQNLLRVNPGFDAGSRLVFNVNVPRNEYRSRADAAAFHTALLERMRELPGVASVGATSTLPLEGLGLGDPLDVRGRLRLSADATPMVRYRRVSNDYFSAMNVPLRSGRVFDTADADGLTDSVVIDEALARLYFGATEPLGNRIRPIEGDPQDRWLTVVGVVGNSVTEGLTETASVGKLYVPLRGSLWADVPAPHDLTYIALVNGDPLNYVDAARTALSSLNPRIALARPEPLDAVLSRARASQAITMLLLIAAATVAAAVGTIGIYAVVSCAVAQRRAEIGVRIAMGATPSQVTAMIVRHSTAIVATGIVTGVALSVVSARIGRALLFGVAPGDWTIPAQVAISALVVAAAACGWPAWRAARIDPVRALHGGS